MTSPRLEAMAKRAALPITVVPSWRGNYLILHAPGLADCGSSFKDTAEATRAYFALVSTFESLDPATPSPGGEPADGCSATVAPRGGL